MAEEEKKSVHFSQKYILQLEIQIILKYLKLLWYGKICLKITVQIQLLHLLEKKTVYYCRIYRMTRKCVNNDIFDVLMRLFTIEWGNYDVTL